MAYVLPFGRAHGTDAWRVGPKAATLSRLYASAFPVPNGHAVTVEALDAFLEANGVTEQVHALLAEIDGLSLSDLGDRPARLRELVERGRVPEALANEIAGARARIIGPVSVRSSSTLEDRADFSFAGQHDSFLNVGVDADLIVAVKGVWASAWSDRAIHYLRAVEVSVRELRMGVVIQEMVEAESSGVAFSVDPLSGDATCIAVSAALGLGEGTVSGVVAPDEVSVTRDPLAVANYAVGAKASKVVSSTKGGTIELEVEDGTGVRALTDEQAIAVAALTIRVEEAMGGNPQDVEWAQANGALFLLQARPMVRPPATDGIEWNSPVPGAHWRRNWRVGEWLSDPVTPLFATWVLPRLVASREEHGTGALGWEARVSFSMPHPWFCLVNGYFYTRQDAPIRPGRDAPLAERALRMKPVSETLKQWRAERIPAYLPIVERHRQRDVTDAQPRELVELVGTLTAEAGEFWPLIGAIGYGFEGLMFKPYYDEVVPEEGRAHYSLLFSGFPSRTIDGQQALNALAERIRADAPLAATFAESAAAELASRMDGLPAWLRDDLDTYVREYGHQVLSLDFYYPTIGEMPEHTLGALKLLARAEATSPYESLAKAAAQREETQRHALSSAPQESREVLAEAISIFQTSASSREDANFYFQTGWPLIRRSVLELGVRLVKAKALANMEEVFFVEADELFGAVEAIEQGEQPSSLSELAEARRLTWEYHKTLDAPDALPAGESSNTSIAPLVGYFDDAPGPRLVGQSASPGRHRGAVRLVRSLADAGDFVRGDILVTVAASPALMPLIIIAGAIVTEAGGGASHSSLIARELGVPAVVNTGVATQVLREGQVVDVDGTQGVVTIEA